MPDKEIYNTLSFRKSINEEFQITKNRVRNLIGDSNWAEEGRYKESILLNMIKKFLPKNFTAGTGFIINDKDGKIKCSTQIDILIFDNNFPPVFNQDDFYIIEPDSVKAIIEVKTQINSLKNFSEILNKLNEIPEKIYGENIDGSDIFIGLFSFKIYERFVTFVKEEQNSTAFKEFLQIFDDKVPYIKCISLGDDIFLRQHDRATVFEVFELEHLSHSYFISNLIESLSPKKKLSKVWFPIDKDENMIASFEIEFPSIFEP